MTDVVEVRTGAYYDSVSLMQVSRTVGSADGVTSALVAMATELNLDLLVGMGFSQPEAGPNDLVIAVRADDDEAAAAARTVLDRELAALSAPGGDLGAGLGAAPPAHTVGSAARRTDATVAVISVPGRYAFAEAMDALEAGLSVMLFSDNVPVEQEVRLKEEGARRGLLVMGPDCGTAILGGAGLGFANAVRPGPVGIVAASGTGAQQMCCLLDAVDVGVSHVLGVGGRDLSAEVGGRSTLQALAALDADPATELIVVISKPPADKVAKRVRAEAARLSKPLHFALLGPWLFGPDQPDLTATAARVAAAVSGQSAGAFAWPTWPAPVEQSPRQSALRGLFSGGTLCTEAVLIASKSLLQPIDSNAGPRIELQFKSNHPAHSMIDFGADEFTRGRPHPMIDFSLRCERLLAEGADPSVGVVLLDVVLGHGAHPDPASEFVPAIRAAREKATAGGRDLAVVVSLCAARDDPQGLERQATALQEAGAAVFLSNAEAADHAAGLVQSGVREQRS